MKPLYVPPVMSPGGTVVGQTEKAKGGAAENSLFKPVVAGDVGFYL